jgi:hypothetical protein
MPAPKLTGTTKRIYYQRLNYSQCFITWCVLHFQSHVLFDLTICTYTYVYVYSRKDPSNIGSGTFDKVQIRMRRTHMYLGLSLSSQTLIKFQSDLERIGNKINKMRSEKPVENFCERQAGDERGRQGKRAHGKVQHADETYQTPVEYNADKATMRIRSTDLPTDRLTHYIFLFIRTSLPLGQPIGN